MTASFFPLTAADIDRALTLMSAFYAEESLDYREARARGALEQLLAGPGVGSFCFIAAGGRVVGYFVLTPGFSLEFAGRFALLDEFYVEAGHRGQGIGAQALAEIERLAASLGAGAVRLEVDRANARGRAFYERHGFVAHDRDLMTRWSAASL